MTTAAILALIVGAILLIAIGGLAWFPIPEPMTTKITAQFRSVGIGEILQAGDVKHDPPNKFTAIHAYQIGSNNYWQNIFRPLQVDTEINGPVRHRDQPFIAYVSEASFKRPDSCACTPWLSDVPCSACRAATAAKAAAESRKRFEAAGKLGETHRIEQIAAKAARREIQSYSGFATGRAVIREVLAEEAGKSGDFATRLGNTIAREVSKQIAANPFGPSQATMEKIARQAVTDYVERMARVSGIQLPKP